MVTNVPQIWFHNSLVLATPNLAQIDTTQCWLEFGINGATNKINVLYLYLVGSLLLKPVMPITSIAMPLIAYQKTSNARTCGGFVKALPVFNAYMR